MRARELGISLGELEPGPLNAITDVAGVRVGVTTLIEGDGPLDVGKGPIRTGVTVVVPPLPAFAAPDRLNGNGEMTGLEWIREAGTLESAIATTNTHSVGTVHGALIAHRHRRADAPRWSLPVVAETWDGFLNDINGFHVREEHVFAALDSASDGAVEEGNVGGGTGMICHGFKGGIGTASRVVDDWAVGVLVQANHGARRRLTIDGVPVGRELGVDRIPGPTSPDGSVIVLAGTDAPLLPHQCARLARRASLGIGRTGGAGETSSGDLVLAFATGNELPSDSVRLVPEERIDRLFHAVIEATEEAILNALLAAETMTGRDDNTVHALDHVLLLEVLRRYGR